MGENEQIILPEGYTKLEYLQSLGQQWLNLPITTNIGDKVVLETECKFSDTSNQAEGKDGKPLFYFGISSGKWYCGSGNSGISSIAADTDWHKCRLTHSQDDTGLYIDEEKILSQTFNSASSLLTGAIYVFKTYNNNYYHKSRKKTWKLFVNDELVYDLIPCLDNNNEPCMYDLVSQQAFYNQGSERFLTDRDYAWNYPLLNNNYNLPYGFKKCVYLQSDGTQWIDTGVAPNNETGLFCKTLKLDNAFGSFFGVRNTSDSSIMSPFMGKNGKSLSYRWKSSSVNDIITANNAGDYSFSSFLNYYNDGLAKFDSEDTDIVRTISGILENYTHNIWLFSTNFQGSFSTDYGKYRGRICRAQITQGDTLIRDFIPCLDGDGRPCMWDSINDVAYYNQSGGTEFTYCVEHQLPSDFLKLKYLESTGTQYIKTGYVPTNTTGLYVDCFNNSKVTSSVIPMGLRDTNGNTYFASPRTAKNIDAGYGWGTFISWGGKGDVRFVGTTNWLNDRKAIITSPAFAQKVASLSDLPFTTTKDIYIFGIHNYDGKYLSGSWKFYRAKISEGSEVVRDFVPAYDTEQQRPCMYDLINAQAFYNEGTGDFDYFPKETNYTGFCQLGVIGNRLGTGEDGLPYGYTRLNYLQSSGKQYIEIDEPFYLNADKPSCGAKLKIHLHIRDLFNPLWGVQPFNSPVVGNTSMYIGRGSDYRFGVLIYAKTSVQYDELNTIWEGEYNYLNSKLMRVTLADGQSKQGDYMLKTWKASAESPKQLLFGMYDSSTGDIFKGTGRIYEAQFTNGTKITRDLIPCLDFNGRPCMYDKVSRKTFYNQGTGEFLYG